MIIGYLTEHATAKTSEIADALNISAPRARAVLSRLLSEDIIIGEGGKPEQDIPSEIIELL